MDENLQKVDHAAIKVNQALIILLNILAFIFNAPWLAAVVALVMILGTIIKKPGFYPLYQYILKPSRIMNPEILLDNPEPHRFAQGFGAIVMTMGSLALFLGASTLGWGLVWLVTGLAALNLFVGFCAGCAVYYWLARINAPGFSKMAPAGTVPGMRPKARAAE
jgi:hypothetical protein